MSIMRMTRRNCEASRESFLDPINFGGAFALGGLVAAGIGAYQAWQGTTNALLWVAVGLIVSQAGVCILDAHNRMKRVIADANESENHNSLQRQVAQIYDHIESIEERRKAETEKETISMWRDIHDIKDKMYEVAERSQKK